MASKKAISFVTSNLNKLAEVNAILADYNLNHVNVDTVEIQGSCREVVIEKCLQAFNQIKTGVLVEDTALSFDSLGGLPGPYVKEFVKNVGPAGLFKLLHGFEDKSASAICMFAYLPPNATPLPSEVQVFEGICPGTIVEPRSKDGVGFGWDPCFQPENYQQTFDEMPSSEKNKISHRSRALQALQKYFENQNA